jgi:indolepyruvate decarboxylase
MPYLIADFLIDRLVEHGVERLFGIPAVFCAAIFDAATRKSGFHTVVTNSDLEAGYAADGYGRTHGLSAVAVSYGPGNLSIVNAIAGAYIERSPVVVVSGGPSQRSIDDQNATGVLYSHSMGKPNTDLDVFRNVTAFCARETGETKVPKLIDDAIAAALVTKHPVYLEAPKDLFSRPCSPPAAPIDTTVPAGAADAIATSILQELTTATNPVVVVGEEVQRYGLASKVLTVLDRLQVRWATTVVGKSVLPEQHPRFMGVFNGDRAPAALRNAIAQAGVIVALGAVLGSGHANLMIPRAGKTIRVWDGSAVIRGGAPQSVGLPALVDRLDSQSVGANQIAYNTPIPAVVDPPPVPATAELGYQQVVDVVAEPAFLDASFSVIADTFLGIYPAARMKMPAQDSFMACALWASIGHSVGAAVGVWRPGGKRPLVLIGDGGFQMVGQAVSTMVRYQQDAIVVIIDNSLYGLEQYLLGPTYYTNPAAAPLAYNVLPDWNFDAFAQSLGVTQVATANTVDGLRTALASAKAHAGGPSVIRALVGGRSLPAGL